MAILKALKYKFMFKLVDIFWIKGSSHWTHVQFTDQQKGTKKWLEKIYRPDEKS